MEDDGWGVGFGSDAAEYPTLTGVQAIKSNKLEHLLAAPVHLPVSKKRPKATATVSGDAAQAMPALQAVVAEPKPASQAKDAPDLSHFVLHPAAARPRVRFAEAEADAAQQQPSKKSKKTTVTDQQHAAGDGSHMQGMAANTRKRKHKLEAAQQVEPGNQQLSEGVAEAGALSTAGVQTSDTKTGAGSKQQKGKQAKGKQGQQESEVQQQAQQKAQQEGHHVQKVSKKQKALAASEDRQQVLQQIQHTEGLGHDIVHDGGKQNSNGQIMPAQPSKKLKHNKAASKQGSTLQANHAVQQQEGTQQSTHGEIKQQIQKSSKAAAGPRSKADNQPGSSLPGTAMQQQAGHTSVDNRSSGKEAAASLQSGKKAAGTMNAGKAASRAVAGKASGAAVAGSATGPALAGKAAGKSQLLDKMRAQLAGARFRSLNEQLYTCSGTDAFEMMQEDPSLFQQYHDGFHSQTEGWPQQPLELAAKWLSSRPADLVVVDFGCGEGRLATIVKQKVHSFDLVAAAPHVVACNMASVPLDTASTDVAVFSLALMGTDYGSFLVEATRVLRHKGWLWIAEVKSRFARPDANGSKEDLKPFLNCLAKLGFQLVSLDTNNTMFFVAVLRKANTPTGSTESLPWPTLKACVYKKR